MSTRPPRDEQDMVAAEYALRVLEGEELAEAQRLERSDPAFAAAVADWQERLAPMFDEVAEATPGPAVWQRIETIISPANDNALVLVRKLRVWRAYGVGASAVAASLALFVVFIGTGRDGAGDQPPAQVAQADRAPVLVATLASQDADTSLSVAFDGQRSSILVTPGKLSGAPGREHELWIIPEGGQPMSLGLVRAGEPQRLPVSPQLAPHFRPRAAIALSLEPVGGSPTAGPTGPVVASGALLGV